MGQNTSVQLILLLILMFKSRVIKQKLLLNFREKFETSQPFGTIINESGGQTLGFINIFMLWSYMSIGAIQYQTSTLITTNVIK